MRQEVYQVSASSVVRNLVCNLVRFTFYGLRIILLLLNPRRWVLLLHVNRQRTPLSIGYSLTDTLTDIAFIGDGRLTT